MMLDGPLVFLGCGLGLGQMVNGLTQKVQADVDAGVIEGPRRRPGLFQPAAGNVPVHDGAGKAVARGKGLKFLVLCDMQQKSVRHTCTS
jgi:hypothetical protein